jgi:hypothetical protein
VEEKYGALAVSKNLLEIIRQLFRLKADPPPAEMLTVYQAVHTFISCKQEAL